MPGRRSRSLLISHVAPEKLRAIFDIDNSTLVRGSTTFTNSIFSFFSFQDEVGWTSYPAIEVFRDAALEDRIAVVTAPTPALGLADTRRMMPEARLSVTHFTNTTWIGRCSR